MVESMMGNGYEPQTKPPENCREIGNLLSEYINGTLPARDVAAIDFHMSGCPNCERFLQSLATTVELTRRLTVDEIPHEVMLRLKEFLKSKISRKD